MDEAVMEAAWNGRFKQAADLIRKGGNFRTCNPAEWKRWGLLWASGYGEIEIVKAILARGVEVNAWIHEALWEAMYYDNREIMDILHAHGAV